MTKPTHSAYIQAVHDLHGPSLARWQQVYRAVHEAITGGALAHGARLPSARQLARDWQVARGAVDEAFDQLQAEGLLVRRVGDGTYVHAPPRDVAPAPARREPPAPVRRLVQHATPRRGPPPRPAKRECAHTAQRAPTLHPRATAIDEFPLERWRRLMLQAHGEHARSVLMESDPAGLPALREAIARHLAVTRGLACDAGQVLVLDSPAHGIALIARVLLEPGDRVWVEDPSHPTMPLLLETFGARVTGVPLDGEGFDVAHGLARAPDAVLAYLHPLAQYPLGLRTSRARGDALLAWAAERRAWIVEGNFNDELARSPAGLPALMRRDRDERVLLLGTFEGIMFPSLRVAYLVLPPALVPAFTRVRALQGHHTAAATQWALAQFMDGGHLDACLRRVREHLSANRLALREALAWMLPPPVRCSALDSGTHFCLHLPPRLRDTDVVARLRQRAVIVEPLSSMAWQAEGLNGLAIGYAAWPRETVLAALRIVCAELAALLAAAPAAALPDYQPSGENT